MPSALRNLFATILVHCNPTDVRKLWDTYYDDMSEDFKRIHENSPTSQLQYTLKSINHFLESMGKRIQNYDIPELEQRVDDGIISECREILEEESIIVPSEDLDAQTKLNSEQEQAFKIILQRSRGMIALAKATNGVAATLLSGGHTAHSRFEIPLQTNDTTVTRMSKQSGRAKLIKKPKLIIWDEASMASRWIIETVDRSFRDLLDIDEPFGGKVMIFRSDFHQVLPVIPKFTRAETVNASLVKSYLWHRMEKIKLTRNIRAKTDASFSELLLRIGNDEEPTIRDDLVLLPRQFVIETKSDSTGSDALIEQIFPSLPKNASSAKKHD